jgi:hypothetical protein
MFSMERQVNPDRHSDPHTVIGSTYVLHPVIRIACAVPTVEMITFDDTNLYPYNDDIMGRSIEGFIWQGTGDMGAFDGIGSPICDLGTHPQMDMLTQLSAHLMHCIWIHQALLQAMCAQPPPHRLFPLRVFWLLQLGGTA